MGMSVMRVLRSTRGKPSSWYPGHDFPVALLRQFQGKVIRIVLEVELGHYPLLFPAKVPTNPLEIARRQTLLHRCRGKGLAWQQPQGLMGQPKARQALGSCEYEQSWAGVT